MWSKFSRTEFLDDLDEAIKKHDQATAHTAKKHFSRAARLNSLGVALLWRFLAALLESMDDIDRAIEINDQVVESLAYTHADLFMWFNNSQACAGFDLSKLVL